MSDVGRRVPKRRMLPANPYQQPEKHGRGANELLITRPPDPVQEDMEKEM